MRAWRSEKSYVTLHAPKKPERFCGADVFETSVLAHEVELAAADCLQSAYVLSKATKLVRSTMLTFLLKSIDFF